MCPSVLLRMSMAVWTDFAPSSRYKSVADALKISRQGAMKM